MCLNDWSSDGCTSDLIEKITNLLDLLIRCLAGIFRNRPNGAHGNAGCQNHRTTAIKNFPACCRQNQIALVTVLALLLQQFGGQPLSIPRSETRRAGKECVSTCRSRWAPDPYK